MMKKTKYFINLTNGIEYLKEHPNLDFDFLRIQSTHCEQKEWDKMLEQLDSNFLMYLALGYKCIVIDYASRSPNRPSRAQWQGLTLIKYVLCRRWFDKEVEIYFDRRKLSDYFKQVYCTLSKSNLKKIDYFKKFLMTNEIDLEIISNPTDKDGKIDFYKEILSEWR